MEFLFHPCFHGLESDLLTQIPPISHLAVTSVARDSQECWFYMNEQYAYGSGFNLFLVTFFGDMFKATVLRLVHLQAKGVYRRHARAVRHPS